MGKIIEFARKDRTRPGERFWQQDYLLFSNEYDIKTEDLPGRNDLPDGAEITLHDSNEARLLVNDQLLRLLYLSSREIREAVFISPRKILRFRYAYRRPEDLLPFTGFINIVNRSFNRFGSLVLDNYGVRCWFPKEWQKITLGGCFDLSYFLTTHCVQEKDRPNRFWVHTHGMKQFGCPDLEVRMVSERGKEPTSQLLPRLTNYLIKHGPVFKDGCRLSIVQGLCSIIFKHYCEMPGEKHYQNDYYRIVIGVKK